MRNTPSLASMNIVSLANCAYTVLRSALESIALNR